MDTGYELSASDVSDLLRVTSPLYRKRVARLLRATIRKAGEGFHYMDESGADISFAEIYRRSQADAGVQRNIYNIWCYYMR